MAPARLQASMKVWVYAVCWNEEDILPYFLRHYSQFCEKIIIYDNHSTDQSQSIIRAYPDTQLRMFDSGNTLRDDIHIRIKNNCWKEALGKADYVVLCDMDEFLYTSHMVQFLQQKQDEGITLFKPMGCTMVSEEFPTWDGMIYDKIRSGFPNSTVDKLCLFSPEAIDEINFEPGCHEANPLGRIRLYESKGDLKLLHFHHLGLQYTLARHQRMRKRLSRINCKMGWGTYYLDSDEAVKKSFKRHLKGSKVIL
jgi:glycosyltransferase involved in cell wall biosynthesis